MYHFMTTLNLSLIEKKKKILLCVEKSACQNFIDDAKNKTSFES